MRAGVKIRWRAPGCWGSEARRGGPNPRGGASGSGGRRRAQLSARPAPRGGACTAVPALPRAPAPPPERRAAVSEWHWQPVNPSARRPSSPVRGGCWRGAWLRQWRRRLLPPHPSAVRPARGPPGPSTGLRAPAAPARPAPKLSSFAHLGPPAGLLLRRCPPPPLPPPGPRGLGSRPAEAVEAAAGAEGGECAGWRGGRRASRQLGRR